MSMHAAITTALAEQHRRDLIAQADACRLARTARQSRPRHPVSALLTTRRVVTTAAAACATAAVRLGADRCRAAHRAAGTS